MLEIAKREAIATSVDCPSFCCLLYSVLLNSAYAGLAVAVCCSQRVEACHVRVSSNGAGDRLGIGGLVPLRVC